MPGPHDVIRVTALSHGGCSIECACGQVFTDVSKDKATARHDGHFGIESVRAALEGEHDGA